MPEASVPSRFLEEVPPQLIENLGSRNPSLVHSRLLVAYGSGRHGSAPTPRPRTSTTKTKARKLPTPLRQRSHPAKNSAPKGKSAGAPPSHRQHRPLLRRKIRRRRPGSFARPTMDIPAAQRRSGLRKGQRVMHSKYGEGTVLMREGDGEDAKLTVLFARHGMKKLMEKFANLRKL